MPNPIQRFNVSQDVDNFMVSANKAAMRDALDLEEDVALTDGSNITDPSNWRTQVGLGNVDNTSDADKPVSTLQQTALNGKADTDGSNIDPAPFRDELNVYDKAEVQTRLNPRAVAGALRFDGGWVTVADAAKIVRESPSFTMWWWGQVEGPVISANGMAWGNMRGVSAYPADSIGINIQSNFIGLWATDGSGNRTVFSVGNSPRLGMELVAVVVDKTNARIRLVLNNIEIINQEYNPSFLTFSSPPTDSFRLNVSTNTNGQVDSARFLTCVQKSAGILNYGVPLETTNGIIGIRDRIRNGSMVVPGLDDRAKFDFKPSEIVFVNATSPRNFVGFSAFDGGFEGNSDGNSRAAFVISDINPETSPFVLISFEIEALTVGEIEISVADLAQDTTTFTGGSVYDLEIISGNATLAPSGVSVFVSEAGVVNLKAKSLGVTVDSGRVLALRAVYNEDGGFVRMGGVGITAYAAPIDLRPDTIQPAPAQWINAAPSHTGQHPIQSATGTKETHVIKEFTFKWETTTNGSVWGGGSDRVVLAPEHTIEKVYVISESGGETVKVGSTAGAEDIVEEITLSEGLNLLPQSKPSSPTNKLSFTSNSTNLLKWTVQGRTLKY